MFGHHLWQRSGSTHRSGARVGDASSPFQCDTHQGIGALGQLGRLFAHDSRAASRSGSGSSPKVERAASHTLSEGSAGSGQQCFTRHRMGPTANLQRAHAQKFSALTLSCGIHRGPRSSLQNRIVVVGRVRVLENGGACQSTGSDAGLAFRACPIRRVTQLEPQQFRVLLLRRLQLPLPSCVHSCRCGRPLDQFGHHRAACARAGILGKRGYAENLP